MRFRIIGGSFGSKGTVLITEQLQVFGEKAARYDISDVDDIIASRIKLRIRPTWYNLAAVLILALILMFLFSVVGFVIAVLAAIIGFVVVKIDRQKADIRLADGNFVSVTGSKRMMSRLITL